MSFNYFEFADNVCDSIYQNLNTLASGTTAQNIWTDSTADLNQAWQLGDSNSTIAAAIRAIGADPTKGKTDIAAFLAKYMNDNYYLDQFSMADITALYNKLSTYYDTTYGPTQMSSIQQFGNLISATQQIETSTGDTETKAEASFMQQSVSSTQPISDLGNSVIGVLTSVGSIMMQSFL